MLPEIVTFNKSMQYRLEEYQQLLDGVDSPCSEVTEVWSSIFEDLVVIEGGWEAVWMLSEDKCKKYDLVFPTAVIVNVNDFNWSDLSASVSVLAVQEDIEIPSELEVPVIELHPIKVQQFDETELESIEDWLDKCRYFFKKLWYPWDAKLNRSIVDWCETHLRNRLKMQYDLKNGVFDKSIANYLKSLLAEAQSINGISDTYLQNEDERLIIVKHYFRRKIIKNELKLFEEPDLRFGMILLKKTEKNLKGCNGKVDNEAKFVWQNGNCQSLIEHLKIVESMLDENIPLKVFGSFQEALDTSNMDDIIILPPGKHFMKALQGIENGGVIKGFNKSESYIMPDSSIVARAILFECFGSVQFENLTISKNNGIAIQVFDGTVKISGCKIVSNEKNSTSKGIVVVSGCKLFLEDCQLQGFGTAIAVQSDTHVSLLNTRIYDCCEGIKVTENSSLSLLNVEISSCSTFGIRVESSKVNSEIPLIGDLNTIQGGDLDLKINATNVSLKDNKKGDVLLKNKGKASGLEPLLEENVSNEIIYISD